MLLAARHQPAILDLSLIDGHLVALRVADVPFVLDAAAGELHLLVDAVARAVIPKFEARKHVAIREAVYLAHLAMQVPADRRDRLGLVGDEVADRVISVVARELRLEVARGIGARREVAHVVEFVVLLGRIACGVVVGQLVHPLTTHRAVAEQVGHAAAQALDVAVAVIAVVAVIAACPVAKPRPARVEQVVVAAHLLEAVQLVVLVGIGLPMDEEIGR